MKKKYFQKLYVYDDKSESYLIQVSLDDYDDVYNEWDPSPFKKRDIEKEFNDFIEESSEDIPLKYNITIALFLQAIKKDSAKETAIISAYRNFYNYAVEKHRREIINLHKKNIYYLVASLLFLSIGYFFKGGQSVLTKVIHEGIFVGGWVFLWEFFTNIFIALTELRTQYKLYRRLYQARVEFVYYE